MEIKAYSVKDLKAALEQTSLWKTDVFPITKHRALSYVNNPRADSEDIVLLVAYEGNRVIGYIGAIPWKIYIENKEKKLAWLTGWWMDSEFRKTGIGRSLLYRILEIYDYDAMIPYYKSTSKRVFDASGRFINLKEYSGIKLLFRFNLSEILVRKIPGIKFLRPLLKIVDAAANLFTNIRQWLWKRNSSIYENYIFEHICCIDSETSAFIKKYRKNELSRYEEEDFNWIFSFPWILSTPVNDITLSDYYFSSVSKKYGLINIKIFDRNKKMAAFAVFRFREKNLNIPFYFCRENCHETILKIAGLIMIDMKLDTLTLNDEFLTEKFHNTGLPVIFKKSIFNQFLITDKYKDFDFSDYYVHEGEGDNIFSGM